MKDLFKKKTTWSVILFVALFAVNAFTKLVVPEWVFGILAALGFAAFRQAIQKVSGNAGWKSYAVAVIVAGVSIANGLGVTLPLDTIYIICGALGLVGVRDAVKDLEEV